MSETVEEAIAAIERWFAETDAGYVEDAPGDAIRTLLADRARLVGEVEEAKRLLVWCRARLKSDGYRSTLDRMQREPAAPDHTPIALSTYVTNHEADDV